MELKQQSLRAVDAAIYAAWKAKQPTQLQKRIRKLWPEQSMLATWTEKRLASGVIRVKVIADYAASFDLKKGRSGYRLVAVRQAKP